MVRNAILDIDGTLAESEGLCKTILESLRGEDFSSDFSEINIKSGHVYIRDGDINMKVGMPNSPGVYADAGSLKGVLVSREEKIYYSLVIGTKELRTGGMPLIVIRNGKFVSTGEET